MAKQLCGPRRCGQREAEEEECHDKEVTSVIQRPEESCSLEPRVTCRHVTRMVPRLQPQHVCTVQPRETCHVSRVPRSRVQRPPLTKWCREPDSGGPGVTRDAAELLRRAKTLGSNQEPQKQVRPRQQNVTPFPKKTPAVTENIQEKIPTLVSKSTTAEKKSRVVISPSLIASIQPPRVSVSSLLSSSNSPPSRPVFDDILDEVHGADFPQARSKTNYNQNKHGVEHLDNAIADNSKDKESGQDTSTRDNVNNGPSAADQSGEIDHILSTQLPPSSQFSPPQETFNQVVSETTSISPPQQQSTPAKVIQTTPRKQHKPRKGYLPTNKSHKKTKKKGGYLSQKSSPGSNNGYLPSSGLSLPPSSKSAKLVLLSLPPPPPSRSLDSNVAPHPEEIGHNNGVRPDTIVNNNSDNNNDNTHVSPNDSNRHRATGGSKQKKKNKSRKGYLPISGVTLKKTSSASRNPDNTDSSGREDTASKRNKAKKKQNATNSSQHKTRKTNVRKSKKLKEDPGRLPKKNKKTDTEQSPFYSLPDSIFDELPEYFRPLPRGLAALIGLSQESQDRRKKY